MENNTLKTAFRRGFTLIELMIVIVILGVLMGTILPRLTGAQARARDTGRVADLNTIAQALETYYDDNGKYPGTSGTPYCLESSTVGHPAVDLGVYLKGGSVPTPPSDKQVTALSGSAALTATATNESSGICMGSYLYMPLTNRGLKGNGFVLLTDVEAFQNANIDTSTAITANATIAVSDMPAPVKLSAEPGGNTPNARASVYMVVQ